MVYMVAVYLVINGKAMFPPKILEKIPEDADLGFDIFNPEEWRKYLLVKYGKYTTKFGDIVTKKPFPIAFKVWRWGGEYYNLFPGYDKDGKKLNLYPYGLLHYNEKR